MSKRFLSLSQLLLSVLVPLDLAYGAGATSEDVALAEFTSRYAPVALSGNGQWRVHVDSKNILYRTNNADPKKVQKVQLKALEQSIPFYAYQMAASRSARKIVFTTSQGCIGLLDLGIDDASPPKQTWLPNGAGGRTNFSQDSTPKELPCAYYEGPIALSLDGRLLATDAHIYDIELGKTVASLPSRLRGLQIHFTKDESKIAITSVLLGEPWEGRGGPSHLKVSLWDIKTHALLNMRVANDTQLSPQETLVAQYLPQNGSVFYVDATNFEKLRAQGASREDGRLDLMELDLHDCASKPKKRLSLAPYRWNTFLIDPLGRWIAGVTNEPYDESKRQDKTTLRTEVLEIYSLQTQKLIQSVKVKEAIAGLTAALDGGKIYASTVTLSGDPSAETQDRRAPKADELIEIVVKVGGLEQPKILEKKGPITPCTFENETSTSRQVIPSTRKLTPYWTVRFKTLAEHQSNFDNRDTGSDTTAVCDYRSTANYLVMKDSSLWIDSRTVIEQLDLNSGKKVASAPTPRNNFICSIAAPVLGGYINYQGDTLSFRPFFPNRDSENPRRTIDKKIGWNITRISLTDKELITLWNPKLGVANKETKDAPSGVIRRYAINSLGFIREHPYDEMDDDAFDNQVRTACLPALNGTTVDIDFTTSHFDSLRGFTCPQTHESQTIFWASLNVSPKARESNFKQKQLLSVAQPFALVLDEGVIRIYDGLARAEVGYFFQNNRGIHSAKILVDKRIVLIEESITNENTVDRRLVAYRF
jgi:hypothetical protein